MRTPTPIYREFAALIAAIANCRKSNNGEWLDKHSENVEFLCKNYMPSGSGIDSGTKIDMDKSTPEKLVFYTSFHHMNDCGMYDGWTEHTITVRASLQFGIDISIGGRDRNQIKEHLHDTYHHALHQKVWVDEAGNWHTDFYGEKPPIIE